MKHRLYKMKFLSSVHFGNGMLSDGELSICADTLFSGLCHEIIKKEGVSGVERLVSYAREGRIQISDLFPYNDESYFLPKPCIVQNTLDRKDSKQYKVAKALKFVRSESMQNYLDGTLNCLDEYEKLKKIGKQSLNSRASIQGLNETMPYHVGSFQFNIRCGLYFILGYEDEQVLEMVDELIQALSFTGIGGKTSSGYGKFCFTVTDCLSKEWEEHLNFSDECGCEYMSLSVSLPKENELEGVVKGARFSLLKRSGFVLSNGIVQKQIGKELRKQNLYVFQHGSCFETCFEGDVYDVANYIMENMHPVYRYAKPMFWRLR